VLALVFGGGRDGCAPGAVARDSADGRVDARAIGCRGGRRVELVTVARHPHAWPGGRTLWPFAPRPAPQVDASRLVLEFFVSAP
jgi:poly(3-hydroxybutyrate) depolymerase